MSKAPSATDLLLERNSRLAKSWYEHLVKTQGLNHDEVILVSTKVLELVTAGLNRDKAAAAR
jgi:hypothetical protein